MMFLFACSATLPPMKAPPKPSRHPGGQPRNRNALRHGLYSRHYTADQRRQMGAMPLLESLDEILMLRSTLERLLSLIDGCDDPDRIIKLYNSLYLGSQRLMIAMRTHTLLVGEDKQLLTSFWEALDLFRKERGL
jgi:hypothetical protein